MTSCCESGRTAAAAGRTLSSGPCRRLQASAAAHAAVRAVRAATAGCTAPSAASVAVGRTPAVGAVAAAVVGGVACGHAHRKRPVGWGGQAACRVRCGQASAEERRLGWGSLILSRAGRLLPPAARIVADIAQDIAQLQSIHGNRRLGYLRSFVAVASIALNA